MLKYSVSTIREAGLNAKWTKTMQGGPIIVASQGEAGSWFYVDKQMWERAGEVGILQAFQEFTCLGEIFSIKI